MTALVLAGKGVAWSVWWGGEGWGEANTHSKHFDFFAVPGWRTIVTLPLAESATHQLRKLDGSGEMWTNREGVNTSEPRLIPQRVENVIVWHYPYLKAPTVQYDR